MLRCNSNNKIRSSFIMFVFFGTINIIAAYNIFETNYFNKYFISIFIICVYIPFWIFIYAVMKAEYNRVFLNHFYKVYFDELDDIEEERHLKIEDKAEESRNRIFGCNCFNIVLHLCIWILLIITFVWMHKNGCYDVVLKKANLQACFYILVGCVFSIGSYAGVLLVNSIREAIKFMRSDVKIGYFEGGYRNYIGIKCFFGFSVVVIYITCLILYICILLGPHTGNHIAGALFVFLFFLIVWPIATTVSSLCCLNTIKTKMKYFSISRVLGENTKKEWKEFEESIKREEYMLKEDMGEKNFDSKLMIVITLVTGIIQTLSII